MGNTTIGDVLHSPDAMDRDTFLGVLNSAKKSDGVRVPIKDGRVDKDSKQFKQAVRRLSHKGRVLVRVSFPFGITKTGKSGEHYGRQRT